MYKKDDWLKAKAAVDEIENARAKLVAHLDFPLKQAQDRLDEVEDDLGDTIGSCESCSTPVFNGEPYHGSVDGDYITCKECSPTYQDMLRNPHYFTNENGDTMGEVEAKKFVDEHVAAGGAITDSLAS